MGYAKRLIDELIEKKSQGKIFNVYSTKMKLVIKGVLPDKITEDTPDSEEVIAKIYEVAHEFNINLTRYR